MFFLPILALGAMALANWRVSRCFLYPPVLFCTWWCVVLLALSASGTLFYSVCSTTLLIFVGGALAFSAGGLLSLTVPNRSVVSITRPSGQAKRVATFLLILAIVAIALLPLYGLYMHKMSTLANTDDSFLLRFRRAQTDEDIRPLGGSFNLSSALLPFYLIFAYIGTYEYSMSRRYKAQIVLMVGIAALYQVFSLARANIMQLLIGLVAIIAIRRGRIPFKMVATAGFLCLTIFAVYQFGLKKMDAEWNGSFGEKISTLTEGIAGYAVGPLVAFDGVVRRPGSVLNTWKPYKYLVRLGNKVGMDLPDIDRDLEYTEIGRGVITNVYTFYFTYYSDYGMIGVVFGGFVFGLISVAIYRMAIRAKPVGVVLFALVVYAIIMSTFAEEFLVEAHIWVKTVLCVVFMYYVLPACPRVKKHSITCLS